MPHHSHPPYTRSSASFRWLLTVTYSNAAPPLPADIQPNKILTAPFHSHVRTVRRLLTLMLSIRYHLHGFTGEMSCWKTGGRPAIWDATTWLSLGECWATFGNEVSFNIQRQSAHEEWLRLLALQSECKAIFRNVDTQSLDSAICPETGLYDMRSGALAGLNRFRTKSVMIMMMMIILNSSQNQFLRREVTLAVITTKFDACADAGCKPAEIPSCNNILQLIAQHV